jgi:hypothetical protein
LKKALERNDPAFEDNYLLRYAAAKGMKDIVELLLKYSSVDPKAKDYWALTLAKENKHQEVYNLLVQRSPENDIEADRNFRLSSTRQFRRSFTRHSSKALLFDLINAESHNRWKEIQQLRDLQLLLDTSTKILPSLERAICQAIFLGKRELAKAMLFFVAFDHSYFNHIVFIRQLIRGNSFQDIRKIDPFLRGNDSIFVNAVRNGNFELANLILDKALKLNPIQPFLSGTLYRKRSFLNIEAALDEIYRHVDNLDTFYVMMNRLERIVDYGRLAEFVFSTVSSLTQFIGFVRMYIIAAKVLGLHFMADYLMRLVIIVSVWSIRDLTRH